MVALHDHGVGLPSELCYKFYVLSVGSGCGGTATLPALSGRPAAEAKAESKKGQYEGKKNLGV